MKDKITLSEFAKTKWLDYAVYTVEERAIPSIVDGLKPSQRYILYSAIKNAKDRFAKIAEIAGVVSSYGYHHGEVSAQDTAVSMAALWENNYPILEADGNFGDRLVQKASGARYIHAKVHKNFWNMFTDNSILPENADIEIQTPAFYLPLVPFVLLNGIKGTATGFATHILPYDVKEVTKLCLEHLKGKDISKKELIPKYPQFNGTIAKNDKGGFDVIGKYELISKTKLVITEVPYKYDREQYVKILDELEENEKILSYVEDCGEHGFRFVITLKRDFSGDIEKVFKLKTTVTENLTVLDQNKKLKVYDGPSKLIIDFCNLRQEFVQLRIDSEIKRISALVELLKAKIKFIQNVLKNKIDFKNKSKKELVTLLIEMSFKEMHIDSILSMNFYHLSQDELEKIAERCIEFEDELIYFKNATANGEYIKDVEKLLKTL